MLPYSLLQVYFYPTQEGINEDLLFYMVEPKNEYLLHMSLWKNVPLTFRMDGNTESMDITIKKLVEHRDRQMNCNTDVDYSYIGTYHISISKC